MRSQASSPVERYADYKTHCLHEIGWANAGVTTPIPLWVRNTGRPVDVPWFRWELSNRVPSSCPVRRIPRQDPLHTTGWESLTNGWYTIIPKDTVKAESLLITEHSSHTSMCINNASLFLAYQSINWFPTELKIANVLPLYKSGDPFCFNNYRPVSLLCVLSKVFEKIMYNRLLDFLADQKVFLLMNNLDSENYTHSTWHLRFLKTR